MAAPPELVLIARVLLAVALGATVGLERESRRKIAGVRTHALVALGAAAFAIAGAYALEDRDATRVAAQVVSGIGFIGAGAIVQSRGSVRGITTAATLWVAAALGLLAGFGLYAVAVSAALASLGVVIILGYITSFVLRTRARQLEITYHTGSGTLAPLFDLVARHGGHVSRIEMHEEREVRVVSLDISGTNAASFDDLVALMTDREEVLHVSADLDAQR